MEMWRLKRRPGGSVCQRSQIGITLIRSSIRIRIEVKSWIRFRIKVKAGSRTALKSKFRSFRGSKWSSVVPWTLKWRPRGSVDQQSQINIILIRIRIRIRIDVKSWIRIRIKVKAGCGSETMKTMVGITSHLRIYAWRLHKWASGNSDWRTGLSPTPARQWIWKNKKNVNKARKLLNMFLSLRKSYNCITNLKRSSLIGLQSDETKVFAICCMLL
jgi:hypothetical protein